MRKSIIYLLSGCLLIATAIAETASPESKSHNVSWGVRSPRDIHLSRQIVSDKAKVLRIVSEDYEYRQKIDKIADSRTITQIVVTDQYTDGDGGYATLKSGGPSTDFAIIHLKSQRGHGYNFTIDIFGQ